MTVKIVLDHRPELGLVRDQGARPLCLSYAASASHEHQRRETTPLSPEYLHYFATTGRHSDPATVEEVTTALRNEGQPPEALCESYSIAPEAGWSPPVGLAVYKRNSDFMKGNAAQIEDYLRKGYAPVLGIALTEAFYEPCAPWIISPAGSIQGYHAVVAVGLGEFEGERYFLIRNSWGIDWGEAGHAWLSEAFVASRLLKMVVLTDEV